MRRHTAIYKPTRQEVLVLTVTIYHSNNNAFEESSCEFLYVLWVLVFYLLKMSQM